MIIKKIKIQNIRSYQDGEIEFPKGSILLSGDIGSGKTSVLLAIEFALFGLQPSQKGSSLLRNNQEEAFVKLEFEVDDSTVIIERGLKKSSKSISQSDCSITINNERFEGSVTEVKNKILEVLNYPPEFAKKTNDLYKFTVYTPQEEMKQIIQESNDTRLNTLRHVFGIDKYKRIEGNVDILTTKLRQEIRIKEAEMGNIEQKRISLKEKNDQIILENEKIKAVEIEKFNISVLKEAKQKEMEEVALKMKEKTNFEKEKAKSEVMLSTKRDYQSNYEREINILKQQIKVANNIAFREEDIHLLKVRINAQEEILKSNNEQYIGIMTNMQNSESRIKDLRKLKDKISSLDKCTTCLQLVNEEHKRNIVVKAESELKEIESKNEGDKKLSVELRNQIELTRKQIEQFRQSLSDLEILKVKLESIKEKQERIINLEKQKLAANSDIDMITKQIDSLNNIIQDFKAYDLAYDQKNKELREVTIKENSILIKKAEMNKEIGFLEMQIRQLNEEIKKIEEQTLRLNYMKEIEFWLNNHFLELVLFTEKNVMLKLREEFSSLFSNWFSTLVSDAITVRLDESFSPIITQNDCELDYAYLSGGERTAVALAYRLALNQVINSLLSKIKTRDLVILDEPTDGFSESQLDKMRDVLNQLHVKQLILVSHEQKIEGFVENIIKFKKVNGITQIDK